MRTYTKQSSRKPFHTNTVDNKTQHDNKIDNKITVDNKKHFVILEAIIEEN